MEIKLEGYWYNFKLDTTELIIDIYDSEEKDIMNFIGTIKMIIGDNEVRNLQTLLKEWRFE